MSIEAMKQALEALELYMEMDTVEQSHLLATVVAPTAITAIKEALAQPEQEPVAYAAMINGEIAWDAEYPFSNEPFSCFDDEQSVPLYTVPPQRQPLLASDIVTMYEENPRSDSEMIAFARAIEAAHGIKEKNT